MHGAESHCSSHQGVAHQALPTCKQEVAYCELTPICDLAGLVGEIVCSIRRLCLRPYACMKVCNPSALDMYLSFHRCYCVTLMLHMHTCQVLIQDWPEEVNGLVTSCLRASLVRLSLCWCPRLLCADAPQASSGRHGGSEDEKLLLMRQRHALAHLADLVVRGAIYYRRVS